MDRSRQYSGYVQFFMNTAVFVGVLASKHLLALLQQHAILAGIIGFAIVVGGHLLVGRLDYLWGLNAEENRRHTEMNPLLMGMAESIKRIEEKLSTSKNEKDNTNNSTNRGGLSSDKKAT